MNTSKIESIIKRKGIIRASSYVCQAGMRKSIFWPMHLKNQYFLKRKFRRLIEEIKEEFYSSPEKYFNKLKKGTLSYVNSNHQKGLGIGSYSYIPGGPSILYASCYAALTRHLYKDLDCLNTPQKEIWINFIKSYQSDDGLFRDPIINIPLAEEIDWWGWRHMTVHALMALTALGGVAEKIISPIKPFMKKGHIEEWLESRDWENNPACVSNEVQNYGVMLQYSRDFQGQEWCHYALQEMFEWLDKTQDPKTGLWGNRFDSDLFLSEGVQTGYHLWLLYFYDKRKIQYIDRIIDSCLKTQNVNGGFGVQLNSSACEDIDSIDPLVRFYFNTDYRKKEIGRALQKALFWIFVNINSDGGWVFRRDAPFRYGHLIMKAERNESAMFSTWFRTLSIALINQLYVKDTCLSWQFLQGPGHQFPLTKK